MTGRNLDPYLGRAFLGDGIATMVAGAGGGTGVTTYAENIGVMAVTKIYSTIVFAVAALAAIVLGFSPKFGATIMTIPGPVLGGSRSSSSASSPRPERASGYRIAWTSRMPAIS
jgi:xanthine/uracil permease